MIPRMTTIELRQFVLDYCSGKIFTSKQVPKEPLSLLGNVFMPLALRALDLMPLSDIFQIGLFWEYMAAAGPRSVNGMPMFASVRYMHKEDVLIVAPLIEAELARRAEYVTTGEPADE